LGVALYQREQPQEAIAAWRQAIAIDPNLAEAFINLDNALKAQQTESAADL
jgi:tetratricopeptide (TPR) repeat protein